MSCHIFQINTMVGLVFSRQSNPFLQNFMKRNNISDIKELLGLYGREWVFQVSSRALLRGFAHFIGFIPTSILNEGIAAFTRRFNIFVIRT